MAEEDRMGTPEVGVEAPGAKPWYLGPLAMGGIAIAAIPVARWSLFEVDHQFANFAGAGCAAFAGLMGFLALLLYPKIGKRVKLAIMALPIVALILFWCMYEFIGFSGEVVPTFRLRSYLRQRPTVRPTRPEDSQIPENAPYRKARFTQFLGDSRDGIVDEPSFSMEWEKKLPAVVWRHSIGEGWSGFAIAEALAVTLEQVDDEEALTALKFATGEFAWQHKMPGRHFNALGGLGPRSTPTLVESDGQWSVVALGASGHLVRVELLTGKPIWEINLNELCGLSQTEFELDVMWGRSSSPLVKDGVVYVPLGGRTVDNDSPKSLIAIGFEDGKEIWRNGLAQVAYASPAFLELDGVPQVVSVNEGCVTGHDPSTGKVLWSSPWPSKSNADACASQPVQVDGQRLLIGKGYAQGSKMIRVTRNQSESATSNGDSNEVLGRFEAEDIWVNTKTLKTKFTNAVHLKGRLYALSDGVLECVDAETGERVWRGGRFGQGQILIVNGKILVMAEDGRVAAVEIDRGKTIAELPVLEGITWNTPAVAGKFLLVRNGSEVVCLESPSGENETGSGSNDVSGEVPRDIKE